MDARKMQKSAIRACIDPNFMSRLILILSQSIFDCVWEVLSLGGFDHSTWGCMFVGLPVSV